MRAHCGLMHEVVISHIQQNSLIPRRHKLLPPRHSFLPTAVLAFEFVSLDPILQSRAVLHVDRPTAMGLRALDRVLVQSLLEKHPVRFFGRADHQRPGEAGVCCCWEAAGSLVLTHTRAARQMASGALSAQMTSLLKILLLITQYQHSVPTGYPNGPSDCRVLL